MTNSECRMTECGERPNKPDRAYGAEVGARVRAARGGGLAVCFTKTVEDMKAGTAKLVQA